MTHKILFRYPVLLVAACAVLGVLFGPRGGDLAAQDHERTSKVCLDCHGGIDSTLSMTGHWPAGDAHEGAGARVACTDCHAGDRKHWEDDPAANPMTNPAGTGAGAEARLCGTCHQNAHQQNVLERNAHGAADVNCSGCHSVHSSTHPVLLRKSEPELCAGCHADVAGQFAQLYRHPVAEGVVKCSECHLTLDATSRTLSLNGTNVCLGCHGEFEGPFPYEHAATLDYSTEEGGCLSCHSPHGSALPKMLRQPHEPPHFQLCTQCHSVPPRHLSNSQHGTAWAGVPCSDCHTDVHGSYNNRLFLNESLVSQGCSNVGCHQF
jgi:DmsE family decaheme c-type cytochrome